MSWLSALALGGLFLLAIKATSMLIYLPVLVESYSVTMEFNQMSYLIGKFIWDDQGVLSVMLPAVWLLCSSLLALSNKFIPKELVIVGVLIGVLFFFYGVSLLFGVHRLAQITFSIGFFMVPFWCLWESFYLRVLVYRSIDSK